MLTGVERFVSGLTSLASGLALASLASCGSSDELASHGAAPPERLPPVAASAHPVDEFHPDRAPRADGTRPPMPPPAYGGRAILHVRSMPHSLNAAIEASGIVRRIAYELNETLLLRNWDTLALEPDLCTDWTVEDQVVRKGAATAAFGRVTEEGDALVVTPVSRENPLHAALRIPRADVERIERGTVFTFHLRPDVVWHDGHPFTARDVDFSLSIYRNPGVKCDDKRFQFALTKGNDGAVTGQDVRSEVLSPLAVRVTYAHAYFMAEASLGDLFLMPSHLYDLADPDNLARADKSHGDAKWMPTSEEEAQWINENAHNRLLVGLGPYKVVSFGDDTVEATRFDGYFDPKRAGYLDTLRWRAIGDIPAAFRAFVAGDLDFCDTVASDDWFSSTAESKAFTDRAYRGMHETSEYWYVGWNCDRPGLDDPRVRRALAQSFDFEEFKNTYYRGYAQQITGPFAVGSPAYDHDVKPYPYDPKAVVKLLSEAGWYDRDGDGLVDRDGKPLSIELALEAGNPLNQAFAAKLQEDLSHAGVQLRIAPMELKSLVAKRNTGDFDAIALGWAPPFESDPGQLWHSVPAGAPKGSNFVDFKDAETDALIEKGRAELDPAKRAAIWRAIHRRVYELQPYLFCYNVSRKYVMIRALRGFQSVAVDPYYVVRHWYYPAGTPGTRATAAIKQD